MDYMGPYIRRQQRIGEERGEARGRAYTLFNGYLEGGVSLEWGAKQFGVSPAQFKEGAQLWEDGGEKDSDLDAFLSQFSLLPRPLSADASTSV